MKTPTKVSRKAGKKKSRPKVRKRRIVEFTPPEGVPISFNIATLGSRFGALLLDVVITYGSLIALFVFLGRFVPMSSSVWWTLFSLMTFLLRIPYYIVTELVWNGRTLGKRIVGIRVISAGGRRLTAHQVTVRNLLREAEFFTPLTLIFSVSSFSGTMRLITLVWLLILVLVPFFSKKRQRIGDIVAGSVVVDTPRPVLLKDLALSVIGNSEEFRFLPHHLDHYGRFELQTLETILHNKFKNNTQRQHIVKVAEAIIKKIGYTDPVQRGKYLDFLFAFYKAQREHLEGHQLFGNVRDNKFYNEGEAEK